MDLNKKTKNSETTEIGKSPEFNEQQQTNIKIQRNTINEEDDEELDISYATNKLKKSEIIESKIGNHLNSHQENENNSDGDYHNIYQDIEPGEGEDQELIDFNQQNAYESEESSNSRRSLAEEEDYSQEEIDFNKNEQFEEDFDDQQDFLKKNVSGKIYFCCFYNFYFFILLYMEECMLLIVLFMLMRL